MLFHGVAEFRASGRPSGSVPDPSGNPCPTRNADWEQCWDSLGTMWGHKVVVSTLASSLPGCIWDASGIIAETLPALLRFPLSPPGDRGDWLSFPQLQNPLITPYLITP